MEEIGRCLLYVLQSGRLLLYLKKYISGSHHMRMCISSEIILTMNVVFVVTTHIYLRGNYKINIEFFPLVTLQAF